MEKNIVELIGAIKKDFMEDIKVIVTEAVEEVLARQTVVTDEKAKETLKKAVEESAKETVEDTVEDAPTRREELQAMSYNDLKALVKSLGGKAVGKAEVIIDRILELEAQAEEEEETLELNDVVEDTAEESVEDGDDSEDEDSSEDEERVYDFLMELSKEELLEIGAKLGYGIPKNWDKEGFANLLLANLEQLEEAFEALGYYDEEDDEEEAEEDSDDLKAQLEALTLEELADLCKEHELSTKGKKQALIDRLLKAQAEGEIEIDLTESDDSDSEEDEDDWYTREELEDLDDEDLIEIGKVNELEIPYTKKKNKKTLNRDALIEAILSLSDEEEDEEDEIVEEDNSNESESSTSQIEVSEERYSSEEEIEEDIRAKYKAKKLKDTVIKKFLTKYNDGNPTYKVPSASEALEEYIEIKTSLVDDEGEVHDLEDCYVRDGVYFCCGRELEDIDKEPYCSVCGTIYEA